MYISESLSSTIAKGQGDALQVPITFPDRKQSKMQLSSNVRIPCEDDGGSKKVGNLKLGSRQVKML